MVQSHQNIIKVPKTDMMIKFSLEAINPPRLLCIYRQHHSDQINVSWVDSAKKNL